MFHSSNEKLEELMQFLTEDFSIREAKKVRSQKEMAGLVN